MLTTIGARSRTLTAAEEKDGRDNSTEATGG